MDALGASDATGHDPLAFYLAYGHPAWMIASLAMAALAFRVGQKMRRARLRGTRRERAWRPDHLRLAKRAVAMIAVGFVLGLASSYGLRGWTPLGTLHGWVGVAALGLFATLGFTGRQLERGRAGKETAEWHGRVAFLAVLAAGLAFFTGFVLLP